MVRVGIAEDIPRIARMLADKLKESGAVQVVWCAKNGKEAIAMLNRDSEIDVLLMDIGMPVMNGIDATREICRRWNNVRVIMSTIFDDDENIFNAILAGASGYLMKDESPESIYIAIQDVLNGGAPMSSGIARKALQLIRTGNPAEQKAGIDFQITDREKDILEHLAKGETYTQMAESLFISVGTVRTHIENIYRKLQVTNKMEAVQKAKHNKIL